MTPKLKHNDEQHFTSHNTVCWITHLCKMSSGMLSTLTGSWSGQYGMLFVAQPPYPTMMILLDDMQESMVRTI